MTPEQARLAAFKARVDSNTLTPRDQILIDEAIAPIVAAYEPQGPFSFQSNEALRLQWEWFNVIVGIAAGIGGGPGPSGGGAVQFNNEQIALLQFFEANQEAWTVATGAGPNAIGWDGSFLWVGCGDGNVSRVDPKTLTSVNFPSTGTDPGEISFDGENVWISNRSSNSITVLRASTGALVTSFDTGTQPRGSCFDGVHMWITMNGDNQVRVYDVRTFALVATLPTGVQPNVAAVDSLGKVWIGNFVDNTLTVYDAASMTEVAGSPFAAGVNPNGLAWDDVNGHMACANYGDATLTIHDGATGAIVATYATGTNPGGVCWDGFAFWANNFGDNTVSKLRASDGAALGVFTVAGLGPQPSWIAFDGVNVWTANLNTAVIQKF